MARKGKSKQGDRKRRAQGRELAFLVLCHLESYAPDEREDAVGLFWDNPPGGGEVGGDGDGPRTAVGDVQTWVREPAARAFAERLVATMLGRWEAVDELIEDASRRWRIARMDRVDRNIIRLVAVELDAVGDTPRAVVLSEAVRIASAYGSERSASFVNGVAETLARRLRTAR